MADPPRPPLHHGGSGALQTEPVEAGDAVGAARETQYRIDRRESRDSIAARLGVAVTAVERVWLVSVGPWSPEFPEVIPNVLGGEFRSVRRWEFTGIEVLELIREPPSAHL